MNDRLHFFRNIMFPFRSISLTFLMSSTAVTLCQFARTHVVKFTGFLAPIDTISS